MMMTVLHLSCVSRQTIVCVSDYTWEASVFMHTNCLVETKHKLEMAHKMLDLLPVREFRNDRILCSKKQENGHSIFLLFHLFEGE